MSTVFKFRMLCDENDSFVRDYEVKYDMNLLDFHDFICDNLDYDTTTMSSFFYSDAQWEKLQEFTLIDVGDDGSEVTPMSMENVTLGQVVHEKGDRLIFIFDIFADRGLFLEVLETKETVPEESYPRVSLSEGDAPDQFDASAIENNDSIFDEAMEDYTEFTGDDHFDHYDEEF